MLYSPWKMVVGNKRDLKKRKNVLEKSDVKKLEGMRIREVSALTNQGVTDAFKLLVQDIQGDHILAKEFQDQEKLKNKEQDEMKEMEVTYT
jgi:GTPase involved in cell partitioning and DNA repair